MGDVIHFYSVSKVVQSKRGLGYLFLGVVRGVTARVF